LQQDYPAFLKDVPPKILIFSRVGNRQIGGRRHWRPPPLATAATRRPPPGRRAAFGGHFLKKIVFTKNDRKIMKNHEKAY
jgi:hypothetical protein